LSATSGDIEHLVIGEVVAQLEARRGAVALELAVGGSVPTIRPHERVGEVIGDARAIRQPDIAIARARYDLLLIEVTDAGTEGKPVSEVHRDIDERGLVDVIPGAGRAHDQ